MGGGLTPLQRSSRCILQPQLTGQREFMERGPMEEVLMDPSVQRSLGSCVRNGVSSNILDPRIARVATGS